jgi:hypothetical protein
MLDEADKNSFEDLIANARRSIASGDADKLHRQVVDIALCSEDLNAAQALFLELSSHSDEFVRGNAILGFGHLARRFRALDDRAIPVVEKGLQDKSKHVRGQAWAAAGDISWFLKKHVSGYQSTHSDQSHEGGEI